MKHKESDKYISAYLLGCPEVRFEGTESDGQTLLFLFSDPDKCKVLISRYVALQTEAIQPKKLFDSLEACNQLIWKHRNERTAKGYFK